MKSRVAEFDALLTPIERFVSVARHMGERALRNEADTLRDIEVQFALDLGTADFEEAALVATQYRLAIEWFRAGLPKVVIGHKHAAALMCTRMPQDVAPELLMPWSAFMVDVPDGLIPVHDTPGMHVRHVGLMKVHLPASYVGGNPDARGSIKCVCIGSDPTGSLGYRTSIATIFEAVDDLRELAARADKYDCIDGGQPMCLALRLLLGVVAELNQPREAATIESSGSRPRTNRRGEPIVTTFTLARDISVDCRAAVREYISGSRGSSPTVQSLVRGHWKKQPCGAARSDRKLIFVEPYWRGPETAPIALRAHVLGRNEKVTT